MRQNIKNLYRDYGKIMFLVNETESVRKTVARCSDGATVARRNMSLAGKSLSHFERCPGQGKFGIVCLGQGARKWITSIQGIPCEKRT